MRTRRSIDAHMDKAIWGRILETVTWGLEALYLRKVLDSSYTNGTWKTTDPRRSVPHSAQIPLCARN